MMIQLILGILTIISISFGIAAMMLLLDVRPSAMTKYKRLLLFLGVFVMLAANFAATYAFGMEQQSKYYMLSVHLPLAILFWAITKIHPIKIVFTLLTAVFLIFPANLLSNLVARFSPGPPFLLGVLCFWAGVICILILVDKFLKKDFHYLIQHYSNHSFLKLFSLPFIYNISIYWVGKYNYTVSMPIDNLILRSLLFLLALTAYLLILDISQADRENEAMLQDQAALSLQLKSANQQMAFLHASQEQTIIYRHDIRHHLALLSSFAMDGDMPKIQEYLSLVTTSIDGITPVRYCENETVNLLLSSFDALAEKNDVTLHSEVVLPQELAMRDTELCALFSNALENAISAACKVSDKKLRKVYIRSLISNNSLVMSTENAYLGNIEMAMELPKSQNNREGHGFGIKSMVAIVERHGGLYSFETANGTFVLQLMLPL